MERSPKKLLFRYWPLIILFVIVLTAFWFRAMPARFNELQALDPFLFYRMSEHVLYNNWQMPEMDMLRYYPIGVVPYEYVTPLPVYVPALTYSALTAVGLSMPYLQFAIIFPAIMGALAVLVMYFVGRELFNSRIAGLFAAFFLAATPAFLTRTSAGFFEKEPIAGVLMMLTILFFITAYKRKSWKHGSLSGIFLALLAMTWGGAQYIYVLIAGFIGIVFGLNVIFVVVNYLFPGSCSSALERLEGFLGLRMIKVFLPLMVLSVFIQVLAPMTLSFNLFLILISFSVLGVLLLRYAVTRFNLVRRENLQYFVPGLMVFGFLVVLVGSMFSGFFSGILYQLGSYFAPAQAGELGTTIAENMPGSLDEVTGKLSNSMSGEMIPPWLDFLSPYFTLWIFMILGGCLLGYKLFKTRRYMYLFVLFWVISSVWSVFAKIRLTFLIGPAAAVAGAFFFVWLIDYAKKSKSMQSAGTLRGRINIISVPVAAIILLAVVFNFANGYVYSTKLGPSICFPMVDEQGNARPCLEINQDSTYKMDENQPWYQAMTFLSESGQDNSVLSWWDFGYWFQARGDKPSVADGGNLGDDREKGLTYAGRNKEIAKWFTSPTDSWSEHMPWLEQYNVGYILMDYTLIGKFGAITSIASSGQQILGFMEFRQSNSYQRDNETVYEFTNGPYAIWVPVDDKEKVTGSLRFMVSQDGKYYQQGYINDVCTTNGIMHVGDEEPAMTGYCVAMSSLGVYLVPPEAEHSIFTNLMFMDGYGLPLEKVFDNVFVKIYKVLY